MAVLAVRRASAGVAALSCCSAFVLAVPQPAAAAARPPLDRSRTEPAMPRRARTVATAPDGVLVDGVELRERAALRLRWPDGPRWARPGLVSLLVRAAESVYRRFPGSVLLVGDLSS